MQRLTLPGTLRFTCTVAACLSAWCASSASAQQAPPALLPPSPTAQAMPVSGAPIAGQLPRYQTQAAPVGMNYAPAATAPLPIGAPQMAPYSAPVQPGYPQLNAPLYPSPRTNIPYWTGVTMITNQALDPHELLYPHTYRAMYPPFYHRVKGGWIVTPFGVKSHEHWELQGTVVEVKYRSSFPIHAPFHAPVMLKPQGPWK